MRAPNKKGTRIMNNVKMNECKVNHEENALFVGRSLVDLKEKPKAIFIHLE